MDSASLRERDKAGCVGAFLHSPGADQHHEISLPGAYHQFLSAEPLLYSPWRLLQILQHLFYHSVLSLSSPSWSLLLLSFVLLAYINCKIKERGLHFHYDIFVGPGVEENPLLADLCLRYLYSISLLYLSSI